MMMYDEIYEDDAEYEASLCRDVVRSFSGLNTLRDTLWLTLAVDSWSDFGVVKTIFFQDFATMTAFRSVIIEVGVSGISWTMSCCEAMSKGAEVDGNAQRFGDMIVEELAPTLGPGGVKIDVGVCSVVFHPQAHLARRMPDVGRAVSNTRADPGAEHVSVAYEESWRRRIRSDSYS